MQLGVQAQRCAFIGQEAKEIAISGQEPFKLASELPDGGHAV